MPEGGRGPRPDPRHDRQPDGLRLAQRRIRSSSRVFTGLLPAEAADPRHASSRARSRRSGRPSPSSRSATEVFGVTASARTRSTCACGRAAPIAPKPAGDELRGGRRGLRRRDASRSSCLRKADLRDGPEHPRLRRLWFDRHCRRCSWRKHFGAHVTAVCNTKNVELVRSLGADEVIDYTREDFTKNGETYDVVFDAVGKHSFRRCRRSLKPRRHLHRDRPRVHVARPAPRAADPVDRRQARDARRSPKYTKEDVVFLKELIEAGEYRAVIDRSIRWRTSSRRRGTSRRGRRRATSCSPSAPDQSSSAISAAARAAPSVSTGR